MRYTFYAAHGGLPTTWTRQCRVYSEESTVSGLRLNPLVCDDKGWPNMSENCAFLEKVDFSKNHKTLPSPKKFLLKRKRKKNHSNLRFNFRWSPFL